jgi:hypothetical protein
MTTWDGPGVVDIIVMAVAILAAVLLPALTSFGV